MKNTFKHKAVRSTAGFIAIFAVIAFSFALTFTSCDNGTTSGGPSLNGTWGANGSIAAVTFSGSTGVFAQLSSGTLAQDAASKGFIRVGAQVFRNLRKTGDLTWTGQELLIKSETSIPNVAVGVEWFNTTITMSVDGQTIYTSSSGTTFTRR